MLPFRLLFSFGIPLEANAYHKERISHVVGDVFVWILWNPKGVMNATAAKVKFMLEIIEL